MISKTRNVTVGANVEAIKILNQKHNTIKKLTKVTGVNETSTLN